MCTFLSCKAATKLVLLHVESLLRPRFTVRNRRVFRADMETRKHSPGGGRGVGIKKLMSNKLAKALFFDWKQKSLSPT